MRLGKLASLVAAIGLTLSSSVAGAGSVAFANQAPSPQASSDVINPHASFFGNDPLFFAALVTVAAGFVAGIVAVNSSSNPPSNAGSIGVPGGQPASP